MTQKNAKPYLLNAVVASSVAILVAGCASDADSVSYSRGSDEMGRCYGVNACKGSGSCATENNHCAGQNACKGQGWLPLAKKDCQARAGKFEGFKST